MPAVHARRSLVAAHAALAHAALALAALAHAALALAALALAALALAALALACGEEGSAVDGGADADAGGADAGLPDGGAADAPAGDAGRPDGGPPDAGPPAWTGPARLSETGLYADFAARTLADGVLAYAPRWPVWVDGAESERYLLLPAAATIATADPEAWVFPEGTRAWWQLRRDGLLVETRFLEKTGEGDRGWRYVSYVWLDDASDALASPTGAANVRGTPHVAPAQSGCLECHRGAADFPNGLSPIQLGGPGGLLERLESGGHLDLPPPGAAALEPPGTPEIALALGTLHGNCAHCHNDRHPLATMRALRLGLPIGVGTPEETPLYRTAIGAMALHGIAGTTSVVVPGRPDESQLYVRMGMIDPLLRMPPTGARLEDPDARAAVRAWIAGLP